MPSNPQLAKYIRGYWLIEAGDGPEVLDLVPDGYPELFFCLQNSVQVKTGEAAWTAFPKAGIIGQLTGRFLLEAAAFSKVIYVKFYPWTPHVLFQIPAWELNDRTPDLSALTSKCTFRTLVSRIGSSQDFDEAVGLLDAFFLEQLGAISNGSPFLHFAVRQIFAGNGTVAVEELTQHIHASRRYVEKLFKAEIGMSPKQYARLIRVKKASMYMLDPQFKGNISAIANSLQYYDQSHFLKDFKIVTGRSPTAFLKEQIDFPLDRVAEYLGQWDYS